MKKQIVALLAGAVLMVGIYSGSASATTINYSSTNTAADKTSMYTGLADFQIETFDNVSLGQVSNAATASGLLPWTWTGSATVVKGSVSGQYAAPFGLSLADKTNFVSVPNPNSSGSVTVNLGGGLYDYFGLWWGSVDNYNTLSFLKGGSVVASYTGSQAISPSVANGNQTASSTNTYINFLDLPDFDSFKMTSNGFAFEADNIAIGNTSAPVPEPGTMMLLGLGMAGLAVYGKRRQNKA